MTAPVLEVSGLSVNYLTDAGAVQAVRDVSFTLNNGESLGVLGESGCGKTSLALTLLRVLPDNAEIVSGKVMLNGVDLLSLSERDMRHYRWAGISMIFQAAMNSFSPVHTVGDQIMEIVRIHSSDSFSEASEKMSELFNLVGIDSALIWRYPHEYSGGMRQRAVIAMALACDPAVIIADEPTTALDVLVQNRILKELRKIQAEKQTAILYISHDVGVIAEMSDRIAVMYAGKIVEVGGVKDVLEKSMHPYPRALMDNMLSTRGPKKELIPLVGEPPNLINLPVGCAFMPRCNRSLQCCSIENHPLPFGDDAHSALCCNPIISEDRN